MAKSPYQQMLLEGQAALQTDQRTVEFERLLLDMFPERDREFLREVLACKPPHSRTTIKQAHASKKFIESRDQFDNDDQAIDFVADIANVSAETLRVTGKERGKKPVTDLLREWEVLPNKTKGNSTP